MKRAYYQDNISNFLEINHEEILGALANNHHFALDIMQKYELESK